MKETNYHVKEIELTPKELFSLMGIDAKDILTIHYKHGENIRIRFVVSKEKLFEIREQNHR